MFPWVSPVGMTLRVAALWSLAVMLALAVACGGGAALSREAVGGQVTATVEPGAVADISTPGRVAAMQPAPTATAIVETPTVEPEIPTPLPTHTPTPDAPPDVGMPVETPTPAPTDPPPAKTAVAPETGDAQPIVTIGGASFVVEVADTRATQQQGLSGREPLAASTGMLFVFEEERFLTFWMKEMNFPLDMVWIDASCKVVDISRDVPIPEPGQTLADLPTYGPETPARYVLEINAGASAAAGFGPGDTVAFTGGLEGKYGC